MTEIRTEDGIWLDISPETEFELTIENPLLRDDRIPASWSTDIPFPPTMLNKRTLGYIGALLAEPEVKKLAATIMAGGLGLFDGTLEYDGIDENGNMLYTFSVRDLEDDWGMKIHELPGLLYDQDSGYSYDSLLAALKADEVEGIHLPLVENEALVAEKACASYIDSGGRPGGGNQPSDPNTERPSLKDLDWGNTDMKYRNSPGASSHECTIPAVELMRLLSNAIGSDGAGDLDSELSRLVIFATWWTRFHPFTRTTSFTYDVGGALPDISLRELVKSVCSMFCAAVFSDRDSYLIRTARSIIGGSDVADWTDRVSDVFTSERVTAQSYELAYDSGAEEASGVLETDGTVDSLSGILEIDSDEYKAMEHTGLEEIYSVKSEDTKVTVSPSDSHPSGRTFDISEILCDRLTEPAPVSSETDDDVMSVTIGLCLARCAPTRHYWLVAGQLDPSMTERMAAILPLPSIESERPAEAYIAVLHEGQTSDRGVVLGADGADSSAGLDITPQALFTNYHKTFADWIGSDRQRLSVSLDLSVYEAANFRMWRKVKILGRIFLVEKLSIRFRAESDEAEVSADMIAL